MQKLIFKVPRPDRLLTDCTAMHDAVWHIWPHLAQTHEAYANENKYAPVNSVRAGFIAHRRCVIKVGIDLRHFPLPNSDWFRIRGNSRKFELRIGSSANRDVSLRRQTCLGNNELCSPTAHFRNAGLVLSNFPSCIDEKCSHTAWIS